MSWGEEAALPPQRVAMAPRKAHGSSGAFGQIAGRVALVCLLMSRGASGEEAWGKAVNGLRCSIAMTPAELRVGDTCVIDVKVENVSDKVTHVYYMTIYQATPLVIADSEGKAVKSRQTGDYGWPHPKEFFHLIKPGDTFATQIKGRVSVKWARAGELPADPAKRDVALLSQDMAYGLGRPGKFTAQLHLIADDRRVAEGKRYGIDPVWTGEMHSNTVAFSVRHMTREELDGFIETLRTGAEEQRREAIRVLAAHGDRQAVPALLDILNKGPGPLQRPVADALGGIQDTSVVPDLLAFYKRFADRGDRASGEFKQCVLQAWSVLEPDKQKRAELFVGVLKSDAAVESRKYAAWNLVYLKHPQRIPTLLAAARDGDRRMQWAAIDVLGSVARETPGEARAQIATALVEILKSAPDRTVRSRAAGALRNVADKSVVPALVGALKDPNHFVGAAAAHSLGQLAGPDAIPVLEQFAKGAERESQADAAKRAIGRIKQRHR